MNHPAQSQRRRAPKPNAQRTTAFRRSLGVAALAALSVPAALWAQRSVPQPSQESLARFAGELEALRSGQGDGRALASSARDLAEAGRADAQRVAQFYIGMDAEERTRGWQAEQDFFALRARVQAAAIDPGDWPAEREAIRAGLLALIERESGAADPSPSARAHALLARLDVARLDQGTTLAPSDRSELERRAAHHCRSARDLFERAAQRTPQLEPLWLQAELARLAGDAGGAGHAYRELGEMAAQVQSPDYRARSLQGLVCLARERGDVVQVEQYLGLWAQLEPPQEHWVQAREQALHLLSQDQPRSALDTLWNCQPEEHAQRAEWQALLASALRRRGHLPAARRAIERLREEFPEEVERGALGEAFQLCEEGRLAECVRALRAAAPFEDWSPAGRVQAEVLLGQALLQDGQPVAALESLEAARDGARDWQARRLGPGSVSGEWLGLHAAVLGAEAAWLAGRSTDASLWLESLQAGPDGWQEEGLERLARLCEQARTQGAGLVTFAFGPDHGLAVYLGPDGQGACARFEGGRADWTRAVRRVREAIAQGQEVRAQMLLKEISGRLWPEALRTALAPGAGAELTLVAHGPLQHLPMHLLTFGDRPLEQVFSPRWLTRLDGAGGTTPAWSQLSWRFVGAPEVHGELPDLPAARAELTELAQRYGTGPAAVGPACNAGALQEAMQSGSALHLATHLVRSDSCDPVGYSSQGVLLQGGAVLCAERLADWARPTPLVYLGTCSSGTGRLLDGEGTLGLARAFVQGGTRNLIVTLWPVEDETAAAFGTAFHAALAQNHPPSVAAALAREALRTEGATLANWAAFVHLGHD
ncbi:MAG: CHAT domain-containing protein [Planctomycetota bacterium]